MTTSKSLRIPPGSRAVHPEYEIHSTVGIDRDLGITSSARDQLSDELPMEAEIRSFHLNEPIPENRMSSPEVARGNPGEKVVFGVEIAVPKVEAEESIRLDASCIRPRIRRNLTPIVLRHAGEEDQREIQEHGHPIHQDHDCRECRGQPHGDQPPRCLHPIVDDDISARRSAMDEIGEQAPPCVDRHAPEGDEEGVGRKCRQVSLQIRKLAAGLSVERCTDLAMVRKVEPLIEREIEEHCRRPKRSCNPVQPATPEHRAVRAIMGGAEKA